MIQFHYRSSILSLFVMSLISLHTRLANDVSVEPSMPSLPTNPPCTRSTHQFSKLISINVDLLVLPLVHIGALTNAKLFPPILQANDNCHKVQVLVLPNPVQTVLYGGKWGFLLLIPSIIWILLPWTLSPSTPSYHGCLCPTCLNFGIPILVPHSKLLLIWIIALSTIPAI